MSGIKLSIHMPVIKDIYKSLPERTLNDYEFKFCIAPLIVRENSTSLLPKVAFIQFTFSVFSLVWKTLGHLQTAVIFDWTRACHVSHLRNGLPCLPINTRCVYYKLGCFEDGEKSMIKRPAWQADIFTTADVVSVKGVNLMY